jgi:putative ABC transport system permease protein
MTYIPLDLADLGIAATLLVANGAISIALGLGLVKGMALAALRMVLQLAVVALALKFVFEVNSPLWTALFALIMLGAAGYEVTSRQERRLPGLQALALGALPPFLAGLLATLFAASAIIAPDPWYAPRYVLPIFGMMLGNALTGTSLVLDGVTQGALRERSAIEARLALGASRFGALHGVLKRALTTALMPILTAMAATGVVSLPGMMTGQILAGVEPVAAAKYQIMIMLLIAGATGLAVVAAGLGAVALITDERHRLRLERVSRKV